MCSRDRIVRGRHHTMTRVNIEKIIKIKVSSKKEDMASNPYPLDNLSIKSRLNIRSFKCTAQSVGISALPGRKPVISM